MLQWPASFPSEVLVQALLATASVFALIVIAVNLLLTCGLLVVCIYYIQKLIGRCNGMLEAGWEKGGAYSAKTAKIVDRAGERVVQPVVWIEGKVEQIKGTSRSLAS